MQQTGRSVLRDPAAPPPPGGYIDSRPWVDLPTDMWAVQPTCRETTDSKTAVSERDKGVLLTPQGHHHGGEEC
jgi:hypothetical protein